MERQGIVNLRSHSLLTEEGLHRVAPANPDDVLVENVRGLRLSFGQDHSIFGIRPRLHQTGPREKDAVVLGQLLAFGVPAIDKAELNQQNRRLQGVETAVPTDLVVVVTT